MNRGDRFKKLCELREAALPWTIKAILWAIIMRENGRTGWTFAGRERLAKDAGIALRTAERYLPVLEKLGIVEVKHRWKKTSMRRVNSEKLQMEIGTSLDLSKLRRAEKHTATAAVSQRLETHDGPASAAGGEGEESPERRCENAIAAASNRQSGDKETTVKSILETKHSSPGDRATSPRFDLSVKKHLENGIYRRRLFESYLNLPPFFDEEKRVEEVLQKAVRELYQNRGRELNEVPEAAVLETARKRFKGISSFGGIRNSERRMKIVVGCVVNAVAETAAVLIASTRLEVGS
jgi:hypothetical protein